MQTRLLHSSQSIKMYFVNLKKNVNYACKQAIEQQMPINLAVNTISDTIFWAYLQLW